MKITYIVNVFIEFFAIYPHLFFIKIISTGSIPILVVFFPQSIYSKSFFIIEYIFFFFKSEVAFCETAVVDSIKKIGFSFSIIACNSNIILGETKRIIKKRFKVNQRYFY